MERVTLGELTAAIAILMAIAAFIKLIASVYKANISEPMRALKHRIEAVEDWRKEQQAETETSKVERHLLIEGVLACLKGLSEKGCNGPVTRAISEIEEFLNNQAHK